ncbi:hypothetical protein QE379_000106 [Sphingomonas sp. SORGH_AS 879]|nr:hypothetical protein [Sphingomonas sp. SORGH_AS_0879]
MRGQGARCLQFEPLGGQLARLDLAQRVAGIGDGSVPLLDAEAGERDERRTVGLPLHAAFELLAGLRAEGDAGAGLAGDRLEAFGVAEKGRQARAHVTDNAGAEGRGGVGGSADRAARRVEAGGAHMVAPCAEHHRDAVPQPDLVLEIEAELLLRVAGERCGQRRLDDRRIVDVIQVDDLRKVVIVALADLVPAIIDAREQGVLHRRAGVEAPLDIVVGGKDVQPRDRRSRDQGNQPSVAARHIRIGRIAVAVGIMGKIVEVAVDVARLQAELQIVGEAMGDEARSLKKPPVIAVVTRLADEQVARQARVAGIVAQRADDRQEVRGRAAMVLLIEAPAASRRCVRPVAR